MHDVCYTPIGVIRSPFEHREGMPIQPVGAASVVGSVVIDPEYVAGLKDLDGFSHIVLFYHFHESRGYSLAVVPFLDTRSRGLFATRAPRRPNAIGMSIVELVGIDANRLSIRGVDVLDNTPLLDVKPYVPAFDRPGGRVRSGWLEGARKQAEEVTADDRFVAGE